LDISTLNRRLNHGIKRDEVQNSEVRVLCNSQPFVQGLGVWLLFLFDPDRTGRQQIFKANAIM
jgi:hypothetical protein